MVDYLSKVLDFLRNLELKMQKSLDKSAKKR